MSDNYLANPNLKKAYVPIDWTEEQSSLIAVRREPSDKEIKRAHCPDAPYV